MCLLRALLYLTGTLNRKKTVILRNISGMRIRPIIIILLALIVTSCGEYEKLLKSSDYELKKQKVFDYYDDGKYTKSIELLERILPRFRATEDAEQLNWIKDQANSRYVTTS